MNIIESKILKEKLYQNQYPCGLRVFVMPKVGYDKKYAMFATHFGSINDDFIHPETKEEIKVPDGVAHFLEHKLFSQKDGSAMDKFAAMGSSSNAYTSFTHTSYLFSCTDGFDDSFKLLLNFVQNPYITDESVENEKGIIGQEIRMYEDDADWQLYFNFINCLYNSHPVKKDIAGTVETISHIDKELLYKCFKTFYDPSNMVIFVVGDVKPEDIFKMVEENVDVNKEALKIEQKTTEEESKVNEPKKEVSLEVALPMFIYGFKTGTNYEDIVKEEIAVNIAFEMLCGKSSKLYQDLYENGLITSPLGIDITFEREYSFISLAGESEKPNEAIQKIKDEIMKMKSNDIDEEVFERIRKRLMGEYIRQFNSVDKIAHMFMNDIMRDVNILEYMDKYSEVTKEDVKKALDKYFNMEYEATSIVNPKV